MRLYKGTAASQSDLKVQSDCAALGFKIGREANASGHVFENSLLNVLVTVELVNGPNGNQDLCKKIPLMALLEEEAVDEGVIKVTNDYLQGKVGIGVDGAIALRDGRYLRVGFEGNANSLDIEIRIIDSPVITNQMWIWDRFDLDNNQQKKIDLVGVQTILFPVSAETETTDEQKVESVRLSYSNKNLEYSAQDLKLIALAANEMVMSGVRQFEGYGNYVVLGVQDVINAEIETGGEGAAWDIYTLKQFAV